MMPNSLLLHYVYPNYTTPQKAIMLCEKDFTSGEDAVMPLNIEMDKYISKFYIPCPKCYSYPHLDLLRLKYTELE